MVASVFDRILSLPGWIALVVVFLLPALEASAFVGFVFPGEVAVILGGVAASRHSVPLWAVIVAAVAGAVIGDTIGYAIGRHFGDRLLRGTLGRLPIIHRHLDRHLEKAQAYVRRRQGSAVFFGRFTAALRVLVPGLAGMSDVHYPTFAAYNAAGGAMWGSTFAVLGYLAGASYKHVEKIASWIGLGLLGAIVLAMVGSRLARTIAARTPDRPTLGDRVAGTRLVVWIRGRYPRQSDWFTRRVAIGDPRGFWLTFVVATGILCAWLFGGITQDVIAHDDSAKWDSPAASWIIHHRAGWLNGLMGDVTWLGSTVIIVPLMLGVAAFLVVAYRRWGDAVGLIVSLGGAVALYHLVKSLTHQPRPSSAMWIGHFTGSGYPSGHATQTIAAYGMAALVLSRGRGPRTQTILWSVAGFVGITVGFSRLYLGAHWLTDVLGGFALGAAWLALVATFLRLGADQRWTSLSASADRERHR